MRVIHKRFMLLRTVFCAVLLLCGPVRADDSAYKVEGIEVDVTADNAVEAREKAFEDAQVKAFAALAERMLNIEELEAYPMPDVATISTFVQDFEVTNERLSAVRYKGTYTFRFRPAAVEQYLGGAQKPYAQQGGQQILILPFMQYGTRTVLWDENNPFMAAWTRAGLPAEGGAVTTVLPLGDLLDVGQMKDSAPLNYDKELLDKMVRRYDTKEAVILLAERKPDTGLAVSIYSARDQIPAFMRTLDIAAGTGMPEDMLYDRAVKEVRAALRQDWAAQKEEEKGPAEIGTLKARAVFSNVQEWVLLKRAVENVTGVREVRVQGLRPKEAVVQVEYAGGVDRLTMALSQAGVGLAAPVSQNLWTTQIPGEAEYELKLIPQERY